MRLPSEPALVDDSHRGESDYLVEVNTYTLDPKEVFYYLANIVPPSFDLEGDNCRARYRVTIMGSMPSDNSGEEPGHLLKVDAHTKAPGVVLCHTAKVMPLKHEIKDGACYQVTVTVTRDEEGAP